jgi:Phage integrase family
MLAILYGSGLRVSEVTRLKVVDIDSARNVLWVRSGKGRKVRQALLPPLGYDKRGVGGSSRPIPEDRPSEQGQYGEFYNSEVFDGIPFLRAA